MTLLFTQHPSCALWLYLLKYRRMKTTTFLTSQIDHIIQNSDCSVFFIKLDMFTSQMKAILAQLTSFPLLGRFIEGNIEQQQ